MALPDGSTQIPHGKLAAIATVLERPIADGDRAVESPDRPGWRFHRVEDPEIDWYLDLFRRVGGPHLWYARLLDPEASIRATLRSERTAIFALEVDGRPEGLAELDMSDDGRCELVYFGVTSGLIGSGAARFMLERVLGFVAARGVPTFWLHTNTNDHPRPLAFYIRAGFVPVRQFLELVDDPRLTGLYPRETAPHIPIFE